MRLEPNPNNAVFFLAVLSALQYWLLLGQAILSSCMESNLTNCRLSVESVGRNNLRNSWNT